MQDDTEFCVMPSPVPYAMAARRWSFETLLQTVAQSLQVQLPQQLSPMEQQIVQIFSSIPADQLEKHFVSGVNAESAKNIVSLESPIEYLFTNRQSLIRQREIPTHSPSYEQAIVDAICAGVATFSAGAPPYDDMTVLVVRWRGAPA